ncbi:MAG: M20 family metallopeptidase [Oscillospiraceae bacterium]|nr:M20 family metallopeptidase [Oscillospiraceae bacterium]
MDKMECAAAEWDYAIAIRRCLHRQPELSNEEFSTMALIKQELTSFNVPYVDVEKGGILAELCGAKKGKTVLLRADIDALPIGESADNPAEPRACVSMVSGVSHMCGHDCHTAMLLAVAKILAPRRAEFSGRVLCVFERGEELTENSYYLLKYLLEREHVDACWAVHMDPQLETGLIGIQSGAVMAGMSSFQVRLTGRGGHGSDPSEASNPIDCFSAICGALNEMRMREISPQSGFSCSICTVESGTKCNIIPEELTFSGTARFFDQAEVGNHFSGAFHRICNAMAAAYRCRAEFLEFMEPSAPVCNHPACAELARTFVGEAIGMERVTQIKPKMGGDSMAEFQLFYPGVYAFLGTKNLQKGCGAELHSSRFDVDEDSLRYGIAATLAYALGMLQTETPIAFMPYKGSLRALFTDMVDRI